MKRKGFLGILGIVVFAAVAIAVASGCASGYHSYSVSKNNTNKSGNVIVNLSSSTCVDMSASR